MFVAMGESSFLPKHILDGSNYGIWEPRMKVEFQAWKLWQTVSENQVAPTNEKALEVYNNKNELAMSMIFRAVSDEVLLMISSSNSAKEAWDKLKEIYLGTKLSRRFTILQKLWQSHQEENESVAIYLNKIIDLKTQLVGCVATGSTMSS